MFTIRALIVAASLHAALPQVRKIDNWGETGILYTATNAKYHLVCEFHGHKKGRKSYPYEEDHVSTVTIRNEQTGESVQYNPPEHDDRPDFTYRDVWSPDGEWLVLPLGSVYGFQLIKARDVLEEMKLSKPKEFLLLTSRKFKAGIDHQFLGWESPASFYLNVTEDMHTTSTYHFSLENFRLDPMFFGTGVADTFLTSRGAQAIHVIPIIPAPQRK